MQAKRYPEAKRRILIARSTADFIAFLKEITDQEGKKFLRQNLLQNRVPGFRPGQAPLERTVPILINQLKKEKELTNPNSTVWDRFEKAWMYWIKSHSKLDNILTDFDNTSDFDENHECLEPPNSELDIKCFEVLLEASSYTPLDQETVKRFYEYGYFNEDERIENLVNQLIPREEIERQERSDQLPNRVDELSKSIEAFNARVSDVESVNSEKRVKKLINQLMPHEHSELNEGLDQLSNKIDELSRLMEILSNEVESFKTRVSNVESVNSEKRIKNLVNQLMQKEHPGGSESLEQLSESMEALSENFKNLKKRVSDVEVANNSGQRDFKQAEVDELLQTIKPLYSKVRYLEEQIPKIEAANKAIQQLRQDRKNELRDFGTKVQQFEKKIKNNKLFDAWLAESESKIQAWAYQVVQQVVESRIKKIESAISENPLQETDQPKIAAEALKIGEHYKTELEAKTERYTDEEKYLKVFHFDLSRYNLIDFEDEDVATAIHIALKAFPALEVDERIIAIWQSICDNHFNITKVMVEMGWFGFQDWYPDLFSTVCFKERLERADLEISIKKMLELGDMPWIVHMSDCDRSLPDCYLPPFLDWIDGFCEGSAKVFLTRTFTTNRCETNEDFYARIARLPTLNPQDRIDYDRLKPSETPLTLSQWKSWCQPDPETDSKYSDQYELLEGLKLAIEDEGVRIPRELLQEVKRYLQLSHTIMAENRAFDWALTLRLLPWVGNRHNLIDVVQNLIEDRQLPHFQEKLQIAREASE